MKIKDCTKKYGVEAKYLDNFLSQIKFKVILPKIEIHEDGQDGKTEEEMQSIKRNYPYYDPKNSTGEYYNGTINLFKNAFESPGTLMLEKRVEFAKGILVHEIAHLIFEKFIENKKDIEWENARTIDGVNKYISKYIEHISKQFSFKSKQTSQEDFCDSFKFFILDKESFLKNSPNRSNFMKHFLVEVIS